MTRTETIRAALESAKYTIQGDLKTQTQSTVETIDRALKLLEGCAVVPREPSKGTLKAMFDACGLIRQSRDMKGVYTAMITEGEKI